jgi:DNA repair protein RecO (recombination protein O)
VLEKDDGLVLRTAPSGETSQIATFLSRRAGKIRLMAKGARSARSPMRGLLEPGNHLEVVYYYKEGRTVFYLREAAQLNPQFSARDSLSHLAVRLAAMELLDQVCYPGSADENIADLAAEYVRCGPATDSLFVFLAFELRLLEALGVLPGLAACVRCGAPLAEGWYSARHGSAICNRHGAGAGDNGDLVRLSAGTAETALLCVEKPLRDLLELRVDRGLRKQLGKIIHWTYTYHVQGYSLPKSLSLI